MHSLLELREDAKGAAALTVVIEGDGLHQLRNPALLARHEVLARLVQLLDDLLRQRRLDVQHTALDVVHAAAVDVHLELVVAAAGLAELAAPPALVETPAARGGATGEQQPQQQDAAAAAAGRCSQPQPQHAAAAVAQWERQPAAAAARGSRSGWERRSRAIGQNCAPVKLVDHIRLLGLRSRGRQPEEVQEDVQEVQEERATRHRRHRHSSAGRWIAFVCKCEWRTMSRRPSALRVLLAVSAQQYKGGSEQESEQESEHQPEHVLEPRARDRAQLSSAPEPEPDSVVVCFRPTLLAQQQAGAGAPHRSRNRVLLVRVRPTLLAQQH